MTNYVFFLGINATVCMLKRIQYTSNEPEYLFFENCCFNIKKKKLSKTWYKKEFISSSMQQKQSLAIIFKEAMKKVLKAALKLYVCNTYIDIVNVLNKNT